jgi:F0F1-type ATP synthase assembly protein I
LSPKQKARLDRRADAHPAGSACKIETLLFERQAGRLRKISQAGTLRRLFDPVTTVNQQHERKPAGGEGTRFLGIGLVWVGSTVLFLYLGSLVDRWVGTDQVFTLVGAGVGIVAGFYYVYRQVAATNQAGRTTRKTDNKE